MFHNYLLSICRSLQNQMSIDFLHFLDVHPSKSNLKWESFVRSIVIYFSNWPEDCFPSSRNLFLFTNRWEKRRISLVKNPIPKKNVKVIEILLILVNRKISDFVLRSTEEIDRWVKYARREFVNSLSLTCPTRINTVWWRQSLTYIRAENFNLKLFVCPLKQPLASNLRPDSESTSKTASLTKFPCNSMASRILAKHPILDKD